MFSAQHSPLRCNSRKNGYDITKTSLIASNYKQETAQQPCSFTTHVQQPRMVMGEGGQPALGLSKCPRGAGNMSYPPPQQKKHCMDLLKSRQQAFWGLKVPKGPPFQTSSHHNILSLSGANRELGMHPLKPRIDLLRHYLDCVRSSMDSLWKRMRILSLN